MRVDLFDFDLPETSIALRPAEPRDAGRLLVVQEAVSVAGFGAEIAATVAERLHKALKAPVKRLGAPRIPISYAPPLEDEVRITEEKIARAAQALVRG